jgi:amino acid adenylation domain-containing protein
LNRELTQEQTRQVLHEFNNTSAKYPLDICLHQHFETQVAATPDRIAVVFDGSTLTYAQLNARSNQLAHYLQNLGAGPDTPVGVFMERSLEMVISLYAILKAGGAYVPLDPEYPDERLGFMLEDAGVSLLLSQADLARELPARGRTTIIVDAGWEQIEAQSRENLACAASSEDLAYIIFTSGTTGRPKGVMNTHRGICNRLIWMQETYGLDESDRVLQKTPFSFNVSVWEFFWPLLFGARLIVARPGGHKDSTYLVDAINQHGITTIHFVPSMLGIFLENDRVDSCRSLRRVICSGENLPYAMQEQFFSLLDAELHNLYGPTEAAVDVTYWHCVPGNELGFVPIGRPVANTQIYILDDAMKPLPIGEPGELHIGGVQVARGYVNRPDLTSERFVPDPFSTDPDARLYKTGDLAAFLPTGDIKFIGRVDHQVKIMGNRIELGEIEATLDRHEAVQRCVVIAREDEPGDKRLVAYLVSRTFPNPSVDELQSYLRKKLPDFMIPSAFVYLDSLPLSPNGKIDRRALPPPAGYRPDLGQAYVPPAHGLEAYLASMWRDILGLDRVGVRDRFFELGGTSLQAARFINRLQQELAENIYIVSIFEAPTISQYAAFLKREYAESLHRIPEYDPSAESAQAVSAPESGFEARITKEAIRHMRECIVTLPKAGGDQKRPPNPPAIFILSPPRSGTTLLRVMLAGHPGLFAASELQLLGFNTLAERQRAYSGKYSLWLEGAIRAVMELKGCGAGEANRLIQEYTQQGLTTQELYALLQEWIGDRVLVDKSPSYVLDLATLEKAERDFRDPLYIHLVRHPYSMIRSFENYHMDQVLFLKPHPFPPRLLGELVWIISHQNAMRFLHGIPDDRQFHLRYEDLVARPDLCMQNLCRSLSLEFRPEMLDPYANVSTKMTDGIYPESKPMGDTRFLEHGRIRRDMAESWKGVLEDDFLSEITWSLAVSLGFDAPEEIDSEFAAPPEPDSVYRARSRQEFLESRRRMRREYREHE